MATNKSTIDIVQQELDDKFLIEQFEQSIVNGGTSADKDLIFNNDAAMFFLAELQYKNMNQNMIMNRPSHVCHARSGCILVCKDVTVYRKVSWNPVAAAATTANNNNDNVFSRVFGSEANYLNYQICFGEQECEHARHGHYCEYVSERGVRCHHMERYEPSNIKKLKDFWVCQETGNVHACGSLCQQQKVMSVYENDYVCSLTGIVTSRNIVHEAGNMTRQMLVSENSGAAALGGVTGAAFDDSKAFRTTVKDNANSVKRRKTTSSNNNNNNNNNNTNNSHSVFDHEAYEESLRWWLNPTEMAANNMIVDYVVEELFFSKRRQMLEADIYLNSYKDAYEEVSKYMRTKKQQHQQQETEQKTINTVMALCIFQYKIPTSAYFKNVPMMPSVRRYILNGLAKLDANFITSNGVDMSFCEDDCGGKNYQDVDNFIRRVLLRKKHESLGMDGNDDDDDDEYDEEKEERKMLCKWHQKSTIVKKMFSVATISIWKNINKNLHELEEFQSMLKFKKILLPLLYMLRKQFIITENITGAVNDPTKGKVYESFANVDSYKDFHFSEEFSKANKLCVIVIPKIDFASLLPNENQLHKFELSSEIVSERYMQSEILRSFGYADDADRRNNVVMPTGATAATAANNRRRRVAFSPSSSSMSARTRNRSQLNHNNNSMADMPKITVAAGGILIMRKITKIHTEIKKIIKVIANCGRLASMQLRMEDVSREIINKKDDMFF